MLHVKYMPDYDFNEIHSIRVNALPQEIVPHIERLDLSDSWIIKILFYLRGLPRTMENRNSFESNGFIELERIADREIIVGLIGQFWRPDGNLQKFNKAEFVSFSSPGFCKATWNFELKVRERSTLVETETRVKCTDEATRRKFSRYWFFIRPFSGLIRMEMLKSIKRRSEQPAAKVANQ